jgi:hypothetical protein
VGKRAKWARGSVMGRVSRQRAHTSVNVCLHVLLSTTKKLVPERSLWPMPASRKPVTVSCTRHGEHRARRAKRWEAAITSNNTPGGSAMQRRNGGLRLHTSRQLQGIRRGSQHDSVSSKCPSTATGRNAQRARTSSPMMPISMPATSPSSLCHKKKPRTR